MSDKVQMKVYVSREARKRVNRESDSNGLSNGDYVERLVWEDAHGRTKAGIEARIENKEQELEAAEQSLEYEQQSVNSIREELEDLRGRRAELEHTAEGYEQDIDGLEDRLESGTRIYQKHPQIKRLSETYGKNTRTVHSDVKEHFGEYPSIAFELSSPQEPTNWKDAQGTTD